MSDVFEKRSVTTELAHRIIAAAEAKADEIGVPMVIAVCDESGVLKAFSRMDGARTVRRADRSGQGLHRGWLRDAQ